MIKIFGQKKTSSCEVKKDYKNYKLDELQKELELKKKENLEILGVLENKRTQKYVEIVKVLEKLFMSIDGDYKFNIALSSYWEQKFETPGFIAIVGEKNDDSLNMNFSYYYNDDIRSHFNIPLTTTLDISRENLLQHFEDCGYRFANHMDEYIKEKVTSNFYPAFCEFIDVFNGDMFEFISNELLSTIDELCDTLVDEIERIDKQNKRLKEARI